MGKKATVVNKKIWLQIINTYAATKTEFEQCLLDNKEKLSFLSKIIPGYMVTIKREIQERDFTGRLEVTHTDSTGKVSFVDIWEVDEKENKAIFLFRQNKNTRNKKTDYDYIMDLEEKIKELKKAGMILTEENNKLKEACKKSNQQFLHTKINKAKAGRPPINKEIEQQILHDCYTSITKTDIAKKYGVTRKTIYNILQRNSD